MKKTKTPFSNQIEILAELWIEYRDDEEFKDFIEYNDVGLPLAYGLANRLVESPTESGKAMLQETWDLLLAGLGVQDTGYLDLEELMNAWRSR